MLHSAGDRPGDVESARLLAADVDNPRLDERIVAAVA